MYVQGTDWTFVSGGTTVQNAWNVALYVLAAENLAAKIVEFSLSKIRQ